MGQIDVRKLDLGQLEEQISEAAKLMEMMSHPARLRILCVMLAGEKSVQKLAADAGLSQPAMSHHLKKLRDSNLVITRRDKQKIFYALKGEHVAAILEVLHHLYCSDLIL
jgi:DNA-binding transcriptional ArsR family regulator